MVKAKKHLKDKIVKKESASEAEKAKMHIIVEIIEYMPDAVVSKNIIKKTSGNVTISSFAEDEEMAEKTSPSDTYIQIIDGAAEVFINDEKFELKLGNGIVIPAHATYSLNAQEKFKMIATVIKSVTDD